MDEQVAVSFIRSDEAVTLLVVEPLDGPGRHAFCTLPSCHARLGPSRARTAVMRLVTPESAPANSGAHSSSLSGGPADVTVTPLRGPVRPWGRRARGRGSRG